LEEKRDRPLILSLTCKHRLDRLDREDHQACKDHLVLKVSLDLKEKPETMDHPDLLALQALEAYLDFLEKTEKLEEMGNPVQLDQQDHLEREAYLACLDFQDQKAIEAFQA